MALPWKILAKRYRQKYEIIANQFIPVFKASAKWKALAKKYREENKKLQS